MTTSSLQSLAAALDGVMISISIITPMTARHNPCHPLIFPFPVINFPPFLIKGWHFSEDHPNGFACALGTYVNTYVLEQLRSEKTFVKTNVLNGKMFLKNQLEGSRHEENQTISTRA
jgi:hypothetical protein